MSNITDDLTFVMQGPIVENVTRRCLGSIRRLFPESSIVLSTWSGSEIEGLDFDTCVLSDDPGAIFYSNSPDSKLNNVNRQIISTRSGLGAVNTLYSFKIRTDFEISNRDFLIYIEMFNKPDGLYKVFEQRVLSCCFFSRDPRGAMPYPFHPSDLAFFGLTSDLKRFFDVPLMTEAEAYWVADKGLLLNRYVPEQHLFINFLKAQGKSIICEHFYDATEKNISDTERYFAENFTMLEFEQFGLVPRRSGFSVNSDPKSFSACYTHLEWLKLYKNHVDGSVVLPDIDPMRRFIEKRRKKYNFYRGVANILASVNRDRKERHELRKRIILYLMTRDER